MTPPIPPTPEEIARCLHKSLGYLPRMRGVYCLSSGCKARWFRNRVREKGLPISYLDLDPALASPPPRLHPNWDDDREKIRALAPNLTVALEALEAREKAAAPPPRTEEPRREMDRDGLLHEVGCMRFYPSARLKFCTCRPVRAAPRTEEEPAKDAHAQCGMPGHRRCPECQAALDKLPWAEDADAPAPSQPQKATHPYEPCGSGLPADCHIACHFNVDEPPGAGHLCNALASDPIHEQEKR